MATGVQVDGARPAGNATLIKLVRSLEKGTQPAPEKLGSIWDALSRTSGGSFHASEEVVLRWLLKNMKAETAEGECFRRYPLVWNILGCVFTRIPLFSLAKSLSERQFTSVLRQSLSEFAKPGDCVDLQNADVEMVDAPPTGEGSTTRKRKRFSPAPFDIQKLRERPRCIESAASAFQAVRILLERIKVITKGSSHEKMGAEHVKSLFSTSAKDAAELIRPMVEICDLALIEQITEPYENQKSWTALIYSIWGFHLQGQQDAYEVATSLSQSMCSILSKLLGYPKKQDISIDPRVKLAWTKDLRLLFSKILITPARTSFLGRKDTSVLETAVEITKSRVASSAPVIFDLVLNAPLIVGEASAKKDNEEWIQKVFNVLEEPVRFAKSLERSHVVSLMLEMTRDHGTRLSPESLRAVCNSYALDSIVNWELLYHIAAADTDVFLSSQDGLDLLAKVLDQTMNLHAVSTDHDHLINFIVTLANGFSQSRDLPGFVKKWFEYSDKILADHEATGSIAVWLDHKIRDKVSDLLQASITPKQLVSLLDWLDTQDTTSQNEALIVVLDTISKGIFEDEFIDAVDRRLFDMAFGRKLRASALQSIASLRWSVTARTISWISSQQSQHIWEKIRSELSDQLKNGSLAEDVTMEAFRCAYAAWVSNYPGGDHESEASDLVSAFLKRLNPRSSKSGISIGPETLDQVLSKCPQLLDLTAKKFGQLPKAIQPNIARLAENRNNKTGILSLFNERNLNNRSIIGNLIKEITPILSTEAGSNIALFGVLLDLPEECFSRDQRELMMLSLLKLIRSKIPVEREKGVMTHWKVILSLMTKLMRRPTFYENMRFNDLVTVGDALVASTEGNDRQDAVAYEVLRLFAEYAKITLRQMTFNVDVREREYLSGAADVMASWTARSRPGRNIICLLLTSAMTTALKDSSNIRSAKHAPIDSEAVRQSFSAEAIALLKDKHLADMSDSVLLISLEELATATSLDIQESILSNITALKTIAEEFCTRGLKVGWKLKTFLIRHCKQQLPQTLAVQLGKAGVLQGHSLSEDHAGLTFVTDRDDILEYINTAIDGLGDAEKLQQLKDLLSGLSADPAPLGKLLAVHRLVDIHAGSDTLGASRIDDFDLASAHSTLSRYLVQATAEIEFTLTAQILHMLLDKRASAMSQWNIEVTLSSVSTVCAQDAAVANHSLKGYRLLCRLVEIIMKRHRLRLEGHFHLLVSVLQSLLTDLLSRKSHESNATSRRDDAKSYSRLLTVVCEPTVASVTRSQPSSLDSATDAAKRLAGQHMYLVLMLYIRLQLEKSVSHDIREALEPGIYSILDISPTEIRRIMNDAMDGSGRAIFRELYKQYLKFGKWSGV